MAKDVRLEQQRGALLDYAVQVLERKGGYSLHDRDQQQRQSQHRGLDSLILANGTDDKLADRAGKWGAADHVVDDKLQRPGRDDVEGSDQQDQQEGED